MEIASKFNKIGHPQIRLCLKNPKRAPTARDIKARGKREAKRSASPLVSTQRKGLGLKGRNISPFSGLDLNFDSLPGATRFALAPGFHIPRLWRWFTYTSDLGQSTQIL